MRCDSCNKFVSLDTQEPEINLVGISGTTVAVDARSVRTCAACGQELKALDINKDVELELDKFEGFDELGEKQQDQLREAWDAGTLEIEVEEAGDGETSESGGSRYKKNILTTTIPFVAKFSWEGLDFTFNGSVTSEHAASEYEEQC